MDNFELKLSDTESETSCPLDLNSVYNEIQKSCTFSELEQYIGTLDIGQLPNLENQYCSSDVVPK